MPDRMGRDVAGLTEGTCCENSECARCGERIRGLVRRISELEEENSNLRLLDGTIRRNTALFHALLANSRDGILLAGPDRGIIRVVHTMTGRAPLEASGQRAEAFVHPDDRNILVGCFERVVASGGREEFEVRALRSDGTYFWIAGTIADMLDDPDVQAIVCNYRDISRWKENELAQAEFQAIVQSAKSAIFSKDAEGTILTWNGGAARTFGFAPEEIVGRNVQVLVPMELREEERRARAQVCQTAAATEFRTERLHKSGSRVAVDVGLSPVLDRYGRVRGILHVSRPVG